MPHFSIVFSRTAKKELKSLPLTIASRILVKIETLATNPRPDGCKKLHGQANLWRIRVGEYRVVYSINSDSHVVDISVIRHRSEAYN